MMTRDDLVMIVIAPEGTDVMTGCDDPHLSIGGIIVITLRHWAVDAATYRDPACRDPRSAPSRCQSQQLLPLLARSHPQWRWGQSDIDPARERALAAA
jgi:hypothetical protein